MQDNFKMWYHEWYDSTNGEWMLEPVYELREDDTCYFYKKKTLYKEGYLNDPTIELTFEYLKTDGIEPLRIDDENCNGVTGEIFGMTFSDKDNKLSCFENSWLPLPYFFKKTENCFDFGPLNWARLKLIPKSEKNGKRNYEAILAFDTRSIYNKDEYNECPVFPDQYRQSMDFELCHDEFFLMDFCSKGENNWNYIDKQLFNLAHPNYQSLSQIKGNNVRHMSYVASYTLLISYLSQKEVFPILTLYKDQNVACKDVDMVVDIGNSRTTAILIEDNTNFNQVRQLELIDYTNLVQESERGTDINKYTDPFDMRLAFRKVDFGNFGIKDSLQFVYPSLVRLGPEANTLIHKATNRINDENSLSTYSSPKRFLWDGRPNREEWKFLVLDGEKDENILYLRGITNQLNSDGKVNLQGNGGSTFHYSRRSLMTFAFLEMLVQANTQINGEKHRSPSGLGSPSMPRKIRRIIVTCPTAMSKVEREALTKCANDAAILLSNFYHSCTGNDPMTNCSVEVVPAVSKSKGDSDTWYYDEATCSQLVYMYGEVANKYKGCSSEFFNLYGKVENGDTQPSITVGSLDIGAGTSDLMICKYSYQEGDITTITPDPKFYDSYYFAGDDMLYALIKNVMLEGANSAFRKELRNDSDRSFRQKMKNFFGKDYSGQSAEDRTIRKNFNLQYSVPLMSYFLELLKNRSKDCMVKFSDVFGNCPPNNYVIEGFKSKVGIDITNLNWEFNYEYVSNIVFKEFEPLLKKVATILYAHACDIVLLSGRPSSLPVIRDIFLKYYCIAPNRLIALNDCYVGDWYPFGENTGYIRNPKTIVAIGGVIAFYASELSNLDKFTINLDLLNENLKSTVNFIEASHERQSINYLITPNKSLGNLTVSSVPTTLSVRQLDLDSYPCRVLYSIDFNRHKMAEKIRKQSENSLTDANVIDLVNRKINELKKRMPFKTTIVRDINDKEQLSIVNILDKDGNELMDGNLEIHIQSLGVNEQYWLDSGAFDF